MARATLELVATSYPLIGLHHVTATVDQAQADLDFCAGALGLRLVKKTVNFDNHHVYHFYYGDAHGTPGTIWTTFPYHGHGVRIGVKGTGQVTSTGLSVPAGSLSFWTDRLARRGITAAPAVTPFGEPSLIVVDPSGLVFDLIEADDRRVGWPAVGASHAIRGLHGVTLTVRRMAPTLTFMTSVLGFQIDAERDGRTRLWLGGAGPGHWVDVQESADGPSALNGLGTVHHVAFAIESADEQRRLQTDLRARGHSVTDVMDRQYFQSIYFREPGGVLFEVATIQPGFLTDEPADALGRALQLPPWEERFRRDIEAGLAPVTLPVHAADRER